MKECLHEDLETFAFSACGDTYGQDKFLFGTDWAVIDPERAMADVMELAFRPEPLRKIQRDNAVKIFDLKP